MTKNVIGPSAEKPLLGAQLCCTSISQESRTQLAEWAQDMGADHTLDLTSDVTHLLVGSTDSKKYQYVAREREDVKVLLPGFLERLRELWTQDEPIDLHALEAEYRCPTLFGLKICITGFENLQFRDELARNITENGAEYSGDLVKDCTHLVAFSAEGKKYEYATSWGLKVVSIKWYKDTLDRGMQLDESKYHPAIHPNDQGVGAWQRQDLSTPRLMKRSRPEQPQPEPNRKLRRTASARLGSQHNDMWNDIVGGQAATTEKPGKETLRPSKSLPLVAPESMRSDPPLNNNLTEQSMLQPSKRGIFSGKHFAIRGFDGKRRAILQDSLLGHGAAMGSKLSELAGIARSTPDVCFLVVPFEIEAAQLNAVEQNYPTLIIVTELWVEWCMTSKSFVLPRDYLLGFPVPPMSLPSTGKYSINATGFHQRQTLHISKLVNKVGATYQENFTPDVNLLICCSANPNRQKLDHARAWQMPVVSEKWLFQLIKTRRCPPTAPFSLFPDPRPQRTTINHDQERTTAPAKNRFSQNALHEAENSRDTVKEVPTTTGKSTRPSGKPASRSSEQDTPLQEITSNIPSRKPTPQKKKLFQSFDGASSIPARSTTPGTSDHHEALQNDDAGIIAVEEVVDQAHLDPPPAPPALEKKSHSDLLNEFFEVKAAAAAKAAATAKQPPKTRSKKLIGRALSNLSNGSRASNDDGTANGRRPLSRASSITSINTDGLGVPLSAMSRVPSDLKKSVKDDPQRQGVGLKGNAGLHRANTTASVVAESAPLTSGPTNNGMSTVDFLAALTTLSTSQPVLPPEPSQDHQISYADSEEAVMLKAKLAEMRRRRSGRGPASEGNGADGRSDLSREESEEKRVRLWREERDGEDEVIRDDETVVGVGRRTRGREKALNALMNEGGAFSDEVDQAFG